VPHITSVRFSLAALAGVALALQPLPAAGHPEGLPDPVRERMANEVPDIETFMQIGSNYRPYLTKDGRTLYYVSSMTGTAQLYRRTPEGWPYQLTFFPNGIGEYNFSPDDHWIAVTSARGGTERYQIYLVDAITGTTLQLTDEPDVRFAVPAFTSDNSKMYFTGNATRPEDFTVYEQDLATGRRRIVLDRKGWTGIYDISRDQRALLVSSQAGSGNNDLYRVDVATGEAVHLTPHEGRALFQPAVFGEDPGTVYLVTDANSDGIPRLAKIAGDPPRLTEFFPGQEARWPVEALTISPDYRTLAWVVNEAGYGRLHLWDLHRAREVPFPKLEGLVANPSLARGGSLAFAFNSPTQSPDVWSWDPARPEEVEQVTFATYAGVDPAWFEAPSLVEYESFDGMKIPAFLYMPKKRPAGPIPFILDVHGGPEQQFRPAFNRHFQYLLMNGYGILAPNVRGSTGYGRAYLDADNYKNRLASVKDLVWGVRYLTERGLTAPGKVGVKGASYGGYMTLAAMTEFPETFAAGIDEVGIANFETYFENTASYRRDLRAAEYGPMDDPDFLRSISPIHKVDRIQGALFVVHGENDPRVPVGEARQILGALVRRGVPVDSLIYPDEGHGASKLANRLVFYRRMVEFFDRHLKGRSG
jgi:dipeptidyl aminopeptidase/acylaminoacyl peptidase